MSEPDKRLERALGENGAFDPEKAEETKRKAVGTFEAKMRKVERYLFAYMCLCCWLIVFAGFHFIQSSTTKAMLFYGLLVLIFFETTILMKLWYWIMNNKISVLKEIKQLQLVGVTGGDPGAASRAKRLEGPLTGLSRRERTVWWVVLLAGGALVGAVKGVEIVGVYDTWDLSRGGSLTSKGCVTLAADGSGSEVTNMSFLHEGTLAKWGFDFHAPDGAVFRFTDSRGRQLPVQTLSEHGQVRYEVSLPRPLMPGRRFSYTRTQECPKLATEEGGVWTYTGDLSYGYDTNEFSQTVVLPEGAEVVSVTPWPVASFTLNNQPTVRFEAKRGRIEPFKYTVRYRLPAKPPSENARE
ncbi:MAG: DUF6768 family protein [Planctomycetota bacterium]|jgi:hypothetical protein